MGHETDTEEGLRRVRLDTDVDASITGYLDDTSVERRWRGTAEGPLVETLGRASADGVTGATTAPDGESQRLLTDQFGQLWVRTGTAAAVIVAHTAVASNQVAPNVVVRRVYQVRSILAAAVVADRFLQIHDSAVAVVDTAEPIWEALVPGSLTLDTTYAEVGESFISIGGLVLTSGLVLAISTTPGTLTLPADEPGDAFFESTSSV